MDTRLGKVNTPWTVSLCVGIIVNLKKECLCQFIHDENRIQKTNLPLKRVPKGLNRCRAMEQKQKTKTKQKTKQNKTKTKTSSTLPLLFLPYHFGLLSMTNDSPKVLKMINENHCRGFYCNSSKSTRRFLLEPKVRMHKTS